MTIPQGITIKIENEYYYKQIKTSRIRLLNWLFGKIYGYKKVYYLADGEMFFFENQLHMNPNTFENLSIVLKEQNK